MSTLLKMKESQKNEKIKSKSNEKKSPQKVKLLTNSNKNDNSKSKQHKRNSSTSKEKNNKQNEKKEKAVVNNNIDIDSTNFKQTSAYKNVNNYRHIFENNFARDENVYWLMKLRHIPDSIRARGSKEVPDTEKKRMTILNPPMFHYHGRDDRDRDKHEEKKNPFIELHTKGNLANTSNEMKVFKGSPPNKSVASFELALRYNSFTSPQLTTSPGRGVDNKKYEGRNDNIITKKDSSSPMRRIFNNKKFNPFKSKNIPVINKFNHNDPNAFFNTKDNFNDDIMQTQSISNNAVSYNELKAYNSEYREKPYFSKNNIHKYSSINDYPVYPEARTVGIDALNKLKNHVTRPIKYDLHKIDYNGQKIFKREVVERLETSILSGSHHSNDRYDKFDNKYKERNINNIRHILSTEGNVISSFVSSSYRCNSKVHDNRQFITSSSQLFKKDYLSNHKYLSNLERQEIKDKIKEMQSSLKLKARNKDSYSNKEFTKVSSLTGI